MEIIPTINVETFEETKKRIEMVEPFTDWVQLDISDGTFTPNVVWHNASDLLRIDTKVKIEVHLMIADLEKKIDDWFIAPVNRVIFQFEAAKDPNFLVSKCKDAGKEVGISIAPGTSWTRLMPFCGKIDLFQVLAVNPGPSGQIFQEESLEKIKSIKENCPSAVVEVDGGVDLVVAKKILQSGADIVNSASAIYKDANTEQNINEFKNAISYKKKTD